MMAPPRLVNCDYRIVPYYAGGILFNLIFSIIALAFVLISPSRPAWLYIFAGVGFYLALNSAIPLRRAINDASQMRACIKDPVQKMRLYVLPGLNEALVEGIRPGYLGIERYCGAFKSDLSDLPGIRLYEYSVRLDRMEPEEASGIAAGLMKRQEELTVLERFETECERLFCLSAVDEDKEAAKELFESRLKKTLPAQKRMDMKRVMMAYSWFVLGDREQAERHAREAEKLAPIYLMQGVAAGELERIDWIQSRMGAVPAGETEGGEASSLN